MVAPRPRASDRTLPRRSTRSDVRDPGPHLVRIAHRMGDLLTTGQVQVRQREVLGTLAPHLDARQAVEIELESGERVVGGRTSPGLPIDDLPRALDRSPNTASIRPETANPSIRRRNARSANSGTTPRSGSRGTPAAGDRPCPAPCASSSAVRSGASSSSRSCPCPDERRSIHRWTSVPIRAAGPEKRGSGRTEVQ